MKDFHCSLNDTLFSGWACHRQKIEDFIDILSKTHNPNDSGCQWYACERVGLDLDSCTSDEIKYIETEVAKRF